MGLDEGTSVDDVLAHQDLKEAIRSLGIQPGTELVVSMLQAGMPAIEAGLQVGDQLHALDGQLIESAAFLNIYLKNYGQRVINRVGSGQCLLQTGGVLQGLTGPLGKMRRHNMRGVTCQY